MVARSRTDSTSTRQFAVQLHDASAGLAVGIGLLKGWSEGGPGDHQPGSRFVIEALEQVLAELRQLSRTLSDRDAVRPRLDDFRHSLNQDAKAAAVDLELRVIGQELVLPPAHLELVGSPAVKRSEMSSGTPDQGYAESLSMLRPARLSLRPGTGAPGCSRGRE